MTPTNGTSSPIEVFCSYSHRDETYKDELLTHLATLRRNQVITAWHDRMIGAGTEWAGQIDTHLKSARVILLLISPSFMASDYCNDVEVAEAMRRHHAGEACVIPIFIRPVNVDGTPFLKLQGLPRDIKPVSLWPDKDEAWLDVVKGIRKTLEMLPNRPRPVEDDQAHSLAKYGIELIRIPAGDFLMGDEDQSDNPRRTVYLDAFLISKELITVKQYLTFCSATDREKPPSPGFNRDWKKEDHPIVRVNWEDARAYCDWLSKHTGQKVTLPTETQWEKAARGTHGRRYPWGDEWDSNRYANLVKPYELDETVAVGTYPLGASPYGILDMVGNVWEWCSDWYDSTYMKIAPDHNPTGPSEGSERVMRSGSWYRNGDASFRCAKREKDSPDNKYFLSGFRCVMSVDAH